MTKIIKIITYACWKLVKLSISNLLKCLDSYIRKHTVDNGILKIEGNESMGKIIYQTVMSPSFSLEFSFI